MGFSDFTEVKLNGTNSKKGTEHTSDNSPQALIISQTFTVMKNTVGDFSVHRVDYFQHLRFVETIFWLKYRGSDEFFPLVNVT